MTIRVEDKVVNQDKTSSVAIPAKTEQKQTVVPIVKNEEQKRGTDEPVIGYYIERNEQASEDDETLDTSVDPDSRITINPSIAIHKTTSEITDAMEQSVKRAISDIFNSSGSDAYYKATTMLKNKQAYNCFSDINFLKRFNVYGKAVYEGVNIKYITNTSAKLHQQENSIKTDIGFNYKSKSEKTKAMLFSSFSKTYTKINTDVPIIISDSSEQKEISDIKSQNESYSFYGAVQQKFNKDIGTLSAFYINDKLLESKTTNVDASYFLNKYMALIQGDVNIYKVLNSKTITKVDLDISLNPERETPENKVNEEVSTKADEIKSDVVPENITKKWSKNFSPFFNTQTINGSTEEGLGLQLRLKRVCSDSKFRVGVFGKFSTTQKDESNQYHLTFGSCLKYDKALNSNTKMNAKLDVKDRTSFCHGNILTTDATLSYISPKITAELEGKYINISKKDSPDYLGVVGRVFYTPNKNINIFAEASYINMKYTQYSTQGANIQAGVMVDF